MMRLLVMRLTLLGALMLALAPMGMTAAQDSEPLAGTHWTLVSMGGASVLPGSTITLEFSATGDALAGERQVSGSGGCNGYGGTYTVNGDMLTISQIISTLMACADDAVTAQESAYFLALQATTHYTLEGNRLTLLTADGDALVFTATSELTGTVWALASIGGEPVVEGSHVTLAFNSDTELNGNGSCNLYRAGYTNDGDSLTIEAVVSTRMACPDEALSEQEMAYFAALETANGYAISERQLIITTESGDELVFTAAATLADTAWTLVAIGETAALESSAITLEFGADGSVRGNGGCNLYRSSYEADGQMLTFAPILSTRRACADPEAQAQEAAFFAALEATTAYAFEDDQLVLTGADGQTLTFAPTAAIEVA